MAEQLDLVDRLCDWLEELSDEQRESLTPEDIARAVPEVARLGDEDIHLVAETFLSRVDYAETPVRTMHDLLVAARAAAGGPR
ncbi:hypothetical protein [Arenibaculum pallidiluteum]|uniref:hypothetical protein n=1 Tax=Arenibaculum pallidiluteum TaxID=2812559 RepID=UPI001A97055F|nr:hypothetical protein [Arenibaculum pallidiluteum]